MLVLIGTAELSAGLRHDYYAELSQGNRVRLDPIPASRGLILDRNGVVLADNEPAYQLELIREQVPGSERYAQAACCTRSHRSRGARRHAPHHLLAPQLRQRAGAAAAHRR
jgi:cell division protein FtsI/penicillin-binding protein 2